MLLDRHGLRLHRPAERGEEFARKDSAEQSLPNASQAGAAQPRRIREQLQVDNMPLVFAAEVATASGFPLEEIVFGTPHVANWRGEALIADQDARSWYDIGRQRAAWGFLSGFQD